MRLKFQVENKHMDIEHKIYVITQKINGDGCLEEKGRGRGETEKKKVKRNL